MYALESVAAWAPGSSRSSFECRGRRSGDEGKQGRCWGWCWDLVVDVGTWVWIGGSAGVKCRRARGGDVFF